MGFTQTSFYPLAVGLGYIVPPDLSFSCRFFYVLAWVSRITGNLYGWDAGAFGIPTFCSPVPQIPSPLKTGSNAR